MSGIEELGMVGMLLRRERSLATPERPVHWTWLHGPAERSDPPPREVSGRSTMSVAY